MQHTARQSKTQDRPTRSYLRLTRQSCRKSRTLRSPYNKHATLASTTHVQNTKGLYPPALISPISLSSPLLYLFSPIHLSPTTSLPLLLKIPASAAYLNTYHSWPIHPVGSYRSLVTAPANHSQFTTDITREPAG